MVKIQRSFAASLLSGAAMLSLSVFVLHQTSTMSPGAATFPQLLGQVLAGFSLLLIASAIWTHIWRKKPRVEEIKPLIEPSHSGLKIMHEVYPFGIIVFCILFMVAFNRIGFELSAFGVMFATMLLIDRREALRKFYYALLTPAFLILIFKFGVGLRLPLLIHKLFE